MTTPRRLPVFEKFIQDVRTAWAELPDTESRMIRTAQLLAELVKDRSLRGALQELAFNRGT